VSEIREKLTTLTCPMCASHEHLQLEETALYVYPIKASDPTKGPDEPPYLDYDDGQLCWSDCGASELKIGGTHQITCYSSICRGYTWKPPKWVVDALEANTLGWTER
jgi:hypothetical protein